MRELVIMQNQQAVTSSLQVAEVFKKEHKKVLRDIRSLVKKDGANFGPVRKMFEETNYTDSKGEIRPMYFMNRDGFTLLAMGYTGAKAMEFKLKYINAFNQMENKIKTEQMADNPDLLIARGYKAALEKTKTLELENKKMKPKALFADAVSTSKSTIDVGQMAKILRGSGLNIGRDRFYAWLRDNGFVIKAKGRSWNSPTQKALDMNVLRLSEKISDNPDGSVTINTKTVVTGKGQIYFVNKLVSNEQLELV